MEDAGLGASSSSSDRVIVICKKEVISDSLFNLMIIFVIFHIDGGTDKRAASASKRLM